MSCLCELPRAKLDVQHADVKLLTILERVDPNPQASNNSQLWPSFGGLVTCTRRPRQRQQSRTPRSAVIVQETQPSAVKKRRNTRYLVGIVSVGLG